MISDLRYSKPETRLAFSDIVMGGALRGKGMPSFADWLDQENLAAIRAYLDQRTAETAAIP